MDEGRALFQQIADRLADSIVDGSLAEATRAPSTNELAAFYRVNPATAAKGINLLVEQGVLHKRRGIGMFVTDGARDRLVRERRESFALRYVDPLLTEATRLGLEARDIVDLIHRRAGRPATGSPELESPRLDGRPTDLTATEEEQQ